MNQKATDNLAPDSPIPGHLFLNGDYPQQTRHETTETFHGEFRGYLPSYWKPATSYYSSRGARGHNGIDIYAPYAPSPLETPVLALFDGKVEYRPVAVRTNAAGNRAVLSCTIAGKPYNLIYGHLSRFAGRSEVKAGDIIGYAGCSGNADTAGECRKCGDCRINSGHIHLIAMEIVGKESIVVDPVATTGLSLRFGPKDDLAKERLCTDWVAANGLASVWTPAPPSPSATRVTGTHDAVWPREAGKRKPLPAPFDGFEFDSTTALRASTKAYDLGLARLRRIRPPQDGGNPVPSAEREVQRFLQERRDAAEASLAGIKDGFMAAQDRILDASGRVTGLEDTLGAVAAGHLFRHISVLSQMLWRLFGGEAIEHMLDNRAGIAGAARFELIDKRNANPAIASLRSSCLVECGAGIRGTAWLSAADRGGNALHFTTDKASATDKEGWVVSVTFGAGSLMHATICEAMLTKNPADDTSDADVGVLKAHVEALSKAATDIREVHRLVHHNMVLLSRVDASGASARAMLAGAVKTALAALRTSTDTIGGANHAALRRLFLTRAVETNAALFGRMTGASVGREKKDLPLAPDLHRLELLEVPTIR